MENKKYLTVSALNKYLAYKIDTDINLKSFIIQGEISNARFSKGHLYFVLKDDDSEISAIMFSNYASNLSFKVEDGIKVLAKCSLQLYQKKRTYSLQVTNMREDGLGVLYQNFLLLKEKLSKEGLFDAKYKKTIPEYSSWRHRFTRYRWQRPFFEGRFLSGAEAVLGEGEAEVKSVVAVL